jgi:hypothetical protein
MCIDIKKGRRKFNTMEEGIALRRVVGKERRRRAQKSCNLFQGTPAEFESILHCPNPSSLIS